MDTKGLEILRNIGEIAPDILKAVGHDIKFTCKKETKPNKKYKQERKSKKG